MGDAEQDLRRPATASQSGDLLHILDQGLVIPVYQPLIDLYSEEVVGYEALARGPEGALNRPDQLFGAAREHGMLVRLDRTCRAAAIRGAQVAGLESPATLFVNVEPEGIDTKAGTLPELAPIPDGIRLMYEITERALAARPADLLPMVDALRRMGVGVALDDVGVDRRSLALMPFLRPDVVKLDLSLTQDGPSERVAEVHNAVSAHAEATGATIVAEGIETEAHLERAKAMGATVGQGWLFGRPQPSPDGDRSPRYSIPIHEHAPVSAETPFRALPHERPRIATKRLLLEISHQLERQAATMGRNAVLLTTFQHADNFTDSEEHRYAELARALAFVGALGEGMPIAPAQGVRGANLPAGDPLIAEWDMVLVGPHFAAALTARQTDETAALGLDQEYTFQLTHDRDLTLVAAHSLMARIAPVAPSAV